MDTTESSRPMSFRRPRPTNRRSTSYSSRRSQFQSLQTRLLRRANDTYRQGLRLYDNLTLLQKIGVVSLAVVLAIGGILSLVYHEAISSWLLGWAKGWRSLTGGWLILWAITFVVSFPPLIGYSTCVMLGGYVYGFPAGWFIVATASTCGATGAFIASRSLLKSYVDRATTADQRFAAFALVLKHDGLKFLCMIRLCPLPFSFSNGALSTIPTISPQLFAIATGLVTPKLLLHVWVGAQLARIAEHGGEMDWGTTLISYAAIALGIVAGLATAYLIYAKTKQRIREIEELEGLEGGAGGLADSMEFEADESDPLAAEQREEEDDDISLRDAWDDEMDDEYRDESSDSHANGDASPLAKLQK